MKDDTSGTPLNANAGKANAHAGLANTPIANPEPSGSPRFNHEDPNRISKHSARSLGSKKQDLMSERNADSSSAQTIGIDSASIATAAFVEAQARASAYSGNKETKQLVSQGFLRVQSGLERIQTRMMDRFASEAPQLVEISQYLLQLGGKRVRPVLALLAAELFQHHNPSEQLIDAAAGIELIHMATLLHDDIIDQSPKRRNQDSAYVKFGFTPSLLAGDFLWVRAFGLCAHLGEFVVRATERACVELTEGEVTEGYLTLQREITLADYIDIISKKTGSLFGLSTCVGAYLANASAHDVEQMTAYGRNAGIAFQIVDDILDIIADETLLGKKSGTDLRQRTPSLVNILWLQSGDPDANEFFSAEYVDEAAVLHAVTRIIDGPTIAQAKEYAQTYVDKSRQSLNNLESAHLAPDVKLELLAILDFTLERCL